MKKITKAIEKYIADRGFLVSSMCGSFSVWLPNGTIVIPGVVDPGYAAVLTAQWVTNRLSVANPAYSACTGYVTWSIPSEGTIWVNGHPLYVADNDFFKKLDAVLDDITIVAHT